MFLAILTFVVGVYVGYKYPQQVAQVIESIKKMVDQLKAKISSKPQ